MTSLQRSIREAWLLYVLAAGLIVVLVGGALLYFKETGDAQRQQQHTKNLAQQNAKNLACIQKWADATSARSRFLTTYLRPRDDAQAALEVAVSEHADPVTLAHLRAVLIRASAAYKSAQKADPVPAAPRFLCVKPAATPTMVPSAHSSPISRAAAPTAAQPTPGPTMPGAAGSAAHGSHGAVAGPPAGTVSRTRTAHPGPTVTRTARPTSGPTSRPPRPSPTPTPSPSSSGVLRGVLCTLHLCP